jgi:hypothetical protein
MRGLASAAIWRIKFRKRVQGVESLVRFLLAVGGLPSLSVDDSRVTAPVTPASQN